MPFARPPSSPLHPSPFPLPAMVGVHASDFVVHVDGGLHGPGRRQGDGAWQASPARGYQGGVGSGAAAGRSDRGRAGVIIPSPYLHHLGKAGNGSVGRWVRRARVRCATGQQCAACRAPCCPSRPPLARPPKRTPAGRRLPGERGRRPGPAASGRPEEGGKGGVGVAAPAPARPPACPCAEPRARPLHQPPGRCSAGPATRGSPAGRSACLVRRGWGLGCARGWGQA